MSALIEIRDEILRLHDFLAAWFNGAVPQTDEAFAEGLADRLHPRFEIVQPSGRIDDRDGILGLIWPAWGTNPAFRISVSDVRLIAEWPASGVLLARYVERQSGARNTTPPENERLSTVIFERGPEHLLWRHVHETALDG